MDMMKLRAACLSDTGVLREENEDSVWEQTLTLPGQAALGLYIVCDGMGGHMGGKYASYWAVEAIKAEFGSLFAAKDPRATLVLTPELAKSIKDGSYEPPPPPETNLEKLTKAAIQKANKVVYDFSRHKPKMAANAGTTVSMAVVRGNQAVIANVGDSRTYLLREGAIHQITRDHSLVANLVAEGEILPDEIYTHPRRNMIYRYLGQKGLAQIDLFHQQLQAGDHLLLCSDGLWEMMRSDRRMAQIILEAGDPQQACQDLLQSANHAGGEDNIGVIVVEVK